jgi:hypothetical protein
MPSRLRGSDADFDAHLGPSRTRGVWPIAKCLKLFTEGRLRRGCSSMVEQQPSKLNLVRKIPREPLQSRVFRARMLRNTPTGAGICRVNDE